jgi:hypothetical protein
MDHLSFLMHQALLCFVVSLQKYCYFFERRSKQHYFVGVQEHQVALAASEATSVFPTACSKNLESPPPRAVPNAALIIWVN